MHRCFYNQNPTSSRGQKSRTVIDPRKYDSSLVPTLLLSSSTTTGGVRDCKRVKPKSSITFQGTLPNNSRRLPVSDSNLVTSHKSLSASSFYEYGWLFFANSVWSVLNITDDISCRALSTTSQCLSASYASAPFPAFPGTTTQLLSS